MCFFFQAEDGIRDIGVTGVQTCALPIYVVGGNSMYDNMMKVEFLSRSENEGFARVAVASFASQLDPTMDEITDVKTAISEAVTNSIIHGYENRKDGIITIQAFIKDRELKVIVDRKSTRLN